MDDGRNITCKGSINDAVSIFGQYNFVRVKNSCLVNFRRVVCIMNYTVTVGEEDLLIAKNRLDNFRYRYAVFNAETAMGI